MRLVKYAALAFPLQLDVEVNPASFGLPNSALKVSLLEVLKIYNLRILRMV